MKKFFMMLGLGVLSLTSCTSSEVVDEPQSNAIGFENVLNKHSRKSALDSDNFGHFYVFGYYVKDDNGTSLDPVPVFFNTAVTKKGVDPDITWEYDDTRYWNPNCTYNFYAYSCGDHELSETFGQYTFPCEVNPGDNQNALDVRGLKIENYVCNANHQHDLVASSVEQTGLSATSENANVRFSFRHALCKVSAEFVNEFPTGYEIKVSNVKIVHFQDKGTLNVRELNGNPQYKQNADGSIEVDHLIWSNPGYTSSNVNEPTIELKNKMDKETGKALNSTESVLMLPVVYDNPNVRLTFDIEVLYNGQVELSRSLQGRWKPVWEPGRSYLYKVHLTGENAKLQPIVFETTQDVTENENWEGNTPADMEFEMAQ